MQHLAAQNFWAIYSDKPEFNFAAAKRARYRELNGNGATT